MDQEQRSCGRYLSTAPDDSTNLSCTLSGGRETLLVSAQIQLSARQMRTLGSEPRSLWSCTVTFLEGLYAREIEYWTRSPVPERSSLQPILYVAGPLPLSLTQRSSASPPSGSRNSGEQFPDDGPQAGIPGEPVQSPKPLRPIESSTGSCAHCGRSCWARSLCLLPNCPWSSHRLPPAT
jgi:hypothetical protein